MAKIEEVTRKTGKQCECSKQGNIVETFKKIYGKWNGVCGPGSFTPSKIASIAIACDACGRTYGPPVFKSMLIDNEELLRDLTFELSLYTTVLTKAVEAKDIEPQHAYKKSKPRRDGSYTVSPYWKKATKVPKQLSKLSIGTIVYIVPRESLGNSYDPTPYNQIQLSMNKGDSIFKIHNRCFK